MPRRQRILTAGFTFHALNRGAKKSRIFECDDDYRQFEHLLATVNDRVSVAIFAYCLMPNHWHFVIAPQADGELSRFMYLLATSHARRWQLIRGQCGDGAVYQGRFKAIPVSNDRHFLTVCRYVERNALRAGLVARAEDWRWSSLWRWQTGDARLLAPWPVPRPDNWMEIVNTPQTNTELEAIRAAIQTGARFGSPTPDPITNRK